jgi:hypothetical protein
MRYKNSLVYVQRQTNLMSSDLRDFAKVYINDIVIFSKTLDKHLQHLIVLFDRLLSYNVILNLKKTFLEYSFIVLFEQVVDALELIIANEKLAIIANLIFSYILKKLEIYVDLTDHLRMYVSWHVRISLLL